MKNLLISTFIALASLPAMAQIEWLSTEHNFGAFHESDGLATVEFRFVNKGNDDVAIVGARANCGCTTPEYQTLPVAPGDTAAVKVAYNPAGRPGRFTKYVQVEISGEPRQRLTISGVVIGEESSVGAQYPAAFGPLRLRRGAMMIGQVEKGKLKTANVSIYNSTADSLRPEFSGMPEYIDVALVPEIIPPGEQATLMAYFRSNKCPLYGLVESRIDITPDPALADSLYSLPLTAIVNEDFSRLSQDQLAKSPVARVGSTTVDLGTVAPGTIAKGALQLSNNGKSTLHIRRAYSTDHGVSAKISDNEVKKNKSTAIEVMVDTNKIAGKLINAKLQLITDDPLNPVQTIRISGIITE